MSFSKVIGGKPSQVGAFPRTQVDFELLTPSVTISETENRNYAFGPFAVLGGIVIGLIDLPVSLLVDLVMLPIEFDEASGKRGRAQIREICETKAKKIYFGTIVATHTFNWPELPPEYESNEEVCGHYSG